ncbi:hypothetical protein GF342_04205 [Candidatus Woesearchaeota archaeon]|nr:hypothetical protein [Candidatus Woesearchaeota archaeon]
MKKRLVLSVVLVLCASLALGDIFDWGLYLQGGSFDVTGSFGFYQSGTKTLPYVAPDNQTHIRSFTYAGHKRNGCSGDMSAAVNPNLISHSSGLDGSYSEDLGYSVFEDLLIRLHGSDDKASGFSNFFKGKSCHYTMSYTYLLAHEEYAEQSFVNRRKQARLLGRVSSFLDPRFTLGTGQELKVFSHNPRVWMFVGDSQSEENKTTTTDPRDNVYACQDLDQNQQCDYNQLEVQDCEAGGGDWLAGRCCGGDESDTDACELYQADDFVTLVRDPSGLSIQQNITLRAPAYCGENQNGDPEWTYLEDIGGIHHLVNCPQFDLSIVSDGTDYYYCGPSPDSADERALSPQSFDYLAIHAGPHTHTYTCQNGQIYECPGDDIAMAIPYTSGGILQANDGRTRALGQITETPDNDQYCRDDGTFGLDLDKYPKACMDAPDLSGTGTEKWTGHYCCSEDLDPADTNESYNDPYDDTAFLNITESSSGGCWQGQYTETSQDLVPKHIVNAQGVYYQCGVTDQNMLSVQDLHTNIDVLQDPGVCGKLILSSNTSAIQRPEGSHAVCQPWGEFTFTDDPTPTVLKSAQWNVTVTNQTHQEGCCPANQCWNGQECQAKNTHMRVGDKGYLCQ